MPHLRSTPPTTYRQLKSRSRPVLDALEALGCTLRRAGPLDDKSAQLVQLAAAAAIRSEGSVHSHVRRAREAGASADEIRHALLLLTSTIGFPTVAAAMSWADDILRPGEPRAKPRTTARKRRQGRR